MYFIIKQAHVGFALVSITLFVVRTLWSVRGSPRLHARWVKTVPHINDSLLLACAIYLAVSAGWNPLNQPWLATKILALPVYIGCGTMAIKRGSTPRARALWGLLATAAFGYIALVALTKDPLPL